MNRGAVFALLSLALVFICGSALALETNKIQVDDNTFKSLPINQDDTESSMKIKKSRTLQHVALTVQNKTGSPVNFWIHIENARINHVLLLRNDGEKQLAGTDYPLSLWKEIGGNIVFRQSLLPGSSYDYIAYTENDGAINTNLNVIGEINALHYFRKFQNITGIMAGSIFGISAFLLFLGFSSRDTTYFDLAVTSTSVALLQINDLGILYPLWPESPQWNQQFSVIFASISTISGCRLARIYLLSKIYSPIINKIFIGLESYILLVFIPVAFINTHQVIVIFIVIPAVFLMGLQLTFSAMQIRKNYKPAKIFFVACLLPLIAGCLIALTFMGVVPSTAFMKLLPLSGTCIQLAIFALALGERINWLNQQSVAAQNIAVQSRAESETKKRFITQISHELRTPLIGIIGLAEIEQDREIDYGRKVLLGNLHRSANYLLSIINNILEFARLEATGWVSSEQTINIRQFITGIVSSYNTKIPKNSISLTCHIYDDVPENISGDKEALKKILGHILDNSIKFTQQGGIVIIVEASSGNSERINLRFEILDTGIGFDKSFSERVFLPFEVADNSSTRPTQGSGIGLSVSRKLCELLGGEIGCDSQKDKGTIFWFSLPFKVIAISQNEHRATPDLDAFNLSRPARNESALCIYAAEDDEALQTVMQGIFEKQGFMYKIFPNGKKLLDAYVRSPLEPDLILLDWNMPVMNAERTIIEINEYREMYKFPATRIAVMTAFDTLPAISPDIKDDILWLKKPVDIKKIKNLLIMR
ncbi:MAG TPA: ATP-binding protein [Pseudomonadales bacterium]|nr:ATP-binding protein [Pseudomonadales bacterium]